MRSLHHALFGLGLGLALLPAPARAECIATAQPEVTTEVIEPTVMGGAPVLRANFKFNCTFSGQCDGRRQVQWSGLGVRYATATGGEPVPPPPCANCGDAQGDPGALMMGGSYDFPPGELFGSRFALSFEARCGEAINPGSFHRIETGYRTLPARWQFQGPILCVYVDPEEVAIIGSAEADCANLIQGAKVRTNARWFADPRGQSTFDVEVAGAGVSDIRTYRRDDARGIPASTVFAEDASAAWRFTKQGSVLLRAANAGTPSGEAFDIFVGKTTLAELRAAQNGGESGGDSSGGGSTSSSGGGGEDDTGGTCSSASGASLLPLALGALALRRRRNRS